MGNSKSKKDLPTILCKTGDYIHTLELQRQLANLLSERINFEVLFLTDSIKYKTTIFEFLLVKNRYDSIYKIYQFLKFELTFNMMEHFNNLLMKYMRYAYCCMEVHLENILIIHIEIINKSSNNTLHIKLCEYLNKIKYKRLGKLNMCNKCDYCTKKLDLSLPQYESLDLPPQY